jgi:hypothetical protein
MTCALVKVDVTSSCKREIRHEQVELYPAPCAAPQGYWLDRVQRRSVPNCRTGIVCWVGKLLGEDALPACILGACPAGAALASPALVAGRLVHRLDTGRRPRHTGVGPARSDLLSVERLGQLAEHSGIGEFHGPPYAALPATSARWRSSATRARKCRISSNSSSGTVAASTPLRTVRGWVMRSALAGRMRSPLIVIRLSLTYSIIPFKPSWAGFPILL